MSDDEETVDAAAEVAVIEAVPWHNADTAAAMFSFAALQAQAVAGLFQNMALLALGQSVHEWHAEDREQFAEETVDSILKLKEAGDVDG